jgi:hypothetical protein
VRKKRHLNSMVLYDTTVPRSFYRVVCRVVFFRHTITVHCIYIHPTVHYSTIPMYCTILGTPLTVGMMVTYITVCRLPLPSYCRYYWSLYVLWCVQSRMHRGPLVPRRPNNITSSSSPSSFTFMVCFMCGTVIKVIHSKCSKYSLLRVLSYY